jgi:hypothetical protein
MRRIAWNLKNRQFSFGGLFPNIGFDLYQADRRLHRYGPANSAKNSSIVKQA